MWRRYSTVGGTVVKKEVFMDMDVPAVTPRGGAGAAHYCLLWFVVPCTTWFVR